MDPQNLTPNPFPLGKGNRTRRGSALSPLTSSNRGAAPHLVFSFPVTGCRGHPCRRRCGTHRGFHIQSSVSSSPDRRPPSAFPDLLISTPKFAQPSVPERRPRP